MDTMVLWNTLWHKWYTKILYNEDIYVVFMNYSTGRHEWKLKRTRQKHFYIPVILMNHFLDYM